MGISFGQALGYSLFGVLFGVIIGVSINNEKEIIEVEKEIIKYEQVRSLVYYSDKFEYCEDNYGIYTYTAVFGPGIYWEEKCEF